jgi:hypothetical protein
VNRKAALVALAVLAAGSAHACDGAWRAFQAEHARHAGAIVALERAFGADFRWFEPAGECRYRVNAAVAHLMNVDAPEQGGQSVAAMSAYLAERAHAKNGDVRAWYTRKIQEFGPPE